MQQEERKRQLLAVKESFSKRPSTMLMVSKDTNILRANVCRYVATLREKKAIYIVKKGLCQISKHPATYYSTDSFYAPKSA